MIWIIFALGAICAGFIQGLTGFAFALIAMSFWVWVISPQLAAPLVVCASVWCHIISLTHDHKQRQLKARHLLMPYLIAGILGVPLGSFLLKHLHIETFKIALGLFLVLWSALMLVQPKLPKIQNAGKWPDSIIGFIGGVLGGLGGFCGAIPSAWLMLKNMSKQEQRYILRHFNFAIQLVTLTVYLWQGNLNTQHVPYLLILLVCVSIPAILGTRLFYRISEQMFKRLILSLLFLSGLVLVCTAL